MKHAIDLTRGNILAVLTKLAMPIMATSLIQMAYNLTDMIWIGRLGASAVAAVGSAGMFMWLASGFTTIARTGGQVMTGQMLGAKEQERASLYAQNALQFGIVFALLYTVVLVAFAKPLIGFYRFNEASTVRDAIIYLQIVGGGMVFSFVNMIFTGLITAAGNSKTPFIATSVGLVANIILDPVLIFGFGPIPALGAGGAAIATVGAQIIVTLMFVRYCLRDSLLKRVRLFSRPDGACIKDIVRIGLPSAVQEMIFAGVAMVIARMVASFGDAAVAVQRVGSQIESISWMTGQGFASALSSFIAQNYGAGDFHRAKKGYHTAVSIIIGWGLFSTALLVFCAGPLFQIFIPDETILPMGISYLVILGYSQVFMCVEIVASGAFSGFGKTLPPSIVATLLTAARIPAAMWLSSTALGLDGIWWSITISSILKGIVLAILFWMYKRRLARAMPQSKQEQSTVSI